MPLFKFNNMKEILTIYSYVDGTNDVPFYDSDNPIMLTEYTYSTQRMGASSLSATLMHSDCLDDHWDGKQYVIFKDERFFLKNTPSSSKANDDERYRHSLEFAPERDIVLSNTYFYDAVSDYSTADDKYKSNSSKVIFTGDVSEFVSRIHQSMKYSGLEFSAHTKKGVSSDIKQIAFEDLTIFEALQQAYEIYEVPFYFVGKEVWFGPSDDAIAQTFEYGADNQLISINKNNANYKVVTRCTGTGSEDNIPYYYPNNSPKGNIYAKAGASNTGLSDSDIIIKDIELYSQKVGQTDTLTCVFPDISNLRTEIVSGTSKPYIGDYMNGTAIQIAQRSLPTPVFKVMFTASGTGEVPITVSWDIRDTQDGVTGYADFKSLYHVWKDGEVIWNSYQEEEDELVDEWEDAKQFTVYVPIEGAGEYSVQFSVDVWFEGHPDKKGEGNLYFYFDTPQKGWLLNGEPVDLKELGLYVGDGARSGDTIVQEKFGWITPSKWLMPPVYRDEMGAERFYNAIDGRYDIPGIVPVQQYDFENEYIRTNPREHIVEFPDIKPTIEGVKNAYGETMAQFLAVEFDRDDNDEKDESGNYIHPYFYVKLPRFNGDFGFNLFDHSIDKGEMTFSMKTGPCAGCNFVLGVSNDEYQQNIVQVNSDGTLKRGADGNIELGQPQERQNDTINNEVWVALKKEDSTFGVLMPNRTQNYRPSVGNQFVILNILLPQAYILAAENRLKEAIIEYMAKNNSDKFNFSINFSRVFFAENDAVYNQINENASITVVYNGKPITLYITSFTYRAEDGESLPEILVELSENITVNRSALQNAINEIRGDIAAGIAGDVLAAGTPHFVSKTKDDVVAGYLKMLKGIVLGENSSITVDGEGDTTAVVDFLKVNKKAVFSQIEIQEKHHVGGQLIVSLAALTCSNVVGVEGAYRCYFEVDGGKDGGIDNLFMVDDQAICQTFNAWGDRYYWRKVVAVGEDYVDLSMEDCDENSDVPAIGDKIVQLGNRTNEERQNAIIIAAYGDDAPCIIQYKGIKEYKLSSEQIVTKLSPVENIFTGKVHMELGSDGFENLGGSLNIGNQNMLRNSGFTGDYLSEPLADNRVMDAADELFSAPFDHWTKGEHIERVELPDNAASGYGVQFPVSTEEVVAEAETLSQELYYPVLKGEAYVLSFKAKGILLSEETNEETGEVVKTYNTISYTIGSETKQVVLTDEWVRYVEKIVVEETTKEFSITASDVTLCEIQLERGTIATGWGNSPWDNSSDRTYVQSIAYLANAMVEEAMTEGATDVLGGLILTNHIKVGNFADNTMIEETAGMNGAQGNGKNTPAFWAGGGFDKAIATAEKYETKTETPEGEVPYVVTHGGKVVLNDAVVRGKVYATGGEFKGDISVDAPNADGSVTINDNGFTYYGTKTNGETYIKAAMGVGNDCSGASGAFYAPNAIPRCSPAAILAIGDDSHRAGVFEGDVSISGTLDTRNGEIVADKIANPYDNLEIAVNEEGSISIPYGTIRGLRPSSRVVSSTGSFSSPIQLTEYDHSILVRTSSTTYIKLPDVPQDGQEYIIETMGPDIYLASSVNNVYSHEQNDTTLKNSLSITARGVFRMKYYGDANMWTFCWIDTY